MNRFNLTSNDSLFTHSEGSSFDPFAGRGASRLPQSETGADPSADSEEQGVRWDLIRRLRREIAAGTYASPERWQNAVSGLSDDLAG